MCPKKVWVFPGTKVHPDALCAGCNEPLANHPRIETFKARPSYAYVSESPSPFEVK